MNTAQTPNLHPTVPLRTARAAAVLAAALLAAPRASADTNTWIGGGGDQNWSTTANWLPAGPLPSTSDIVFTNIAATGTPGPSGTANNVVDTSLAVQSLTYRNTNAYHTTFIGDGVTLSVGSTNVTPGYANPALMIGNLVSADEGGAPTNYTTILGLKGTLVVTNNQVINVRKGSNSTGTHRATLDLSGLGTFRAYISQLLLAADGSGIPYTGPNRPQGWLELARTNLIVAIGGNFPVAGSPGILISDSQSGAGSSLLWLGQTNALFADTMTFGARKCSCYVGFDTNASLAPPLINPTVLIRNSAGTGPMSLWSIGDRALDTGSTTSSGTALVDLAGGGGSVDAQVNTLYVGRGQSAQAGSGGPSSAATGVLTFTNGTITAGVLEIGYQWVANAGAVGTVNVGGLGQLTVSGGAPSSYLRLGNFISATAAGGIPRGTLNIGLPVAGGSVWVNGPLIDGGGTGNSITVAGGSLKVSGTLGSSASPLQFLTLNNATLTFDFGTTPNPATPWWQVGSLTVTAPVTNNVLGTALTPGQFPLLKYASLGGDDGSGFALGGLPPHVNAYLSNNVANQSIDLVITSVSTPKWNGNINGNWDINTTANWRPVSGGGGAITYLQYNVPGDPVLFDDTAAGTTTVNLATTLSPSGITVNNAAKDYTFTGSGALSGPTSLQKGGSGTLTISNTGTNNFVGVVAINGGKVRISGGANLLPTNAAVTLADDPTAVLDLNNANQVLGSLSGGGESGGNVTLGTGTLTLNGDGGIYRGVISGNGKVVKGGSGTQVFNGNNVYAGGTLVNGGTLVVANTNGSGLGSGSVTVQTNGNLQLGAGPAGAGGSVAAGIITNNGSVTFNRSDDFALTTRLTGTGGLIKGLAGNAETVAIDNPNTYSGGTTINYGTLRVSDSGALGTGPVFISSYYANGAWSVLALSNGVTLVQPVTVSQKGGGYTYAVIDNIDGTNTLAGPITLVGGYNGGGSWNITSDAGDLIIRGACTVATGQYSVAGLHPILLAGAGNGEWWGGINNLSGNAEITALVMNGSGTWTIGGTNNYTGYTAVNSGQLIVNGALTGSTNIAVGTGQFGAGASLSGTGRITGPVEVTYGGTLCGNGASASGVPSGAPPGRLTISNSLTLDLGAVTIMGVSHAAYDQVAGLTSLSPGGSVLQVVITGPLVGGEGFKLFDSAYYDGSDFSWYNLPPLPDPLSWDHTSMPVDGTLRVAGTLVPQLRTFGLTGGRDFQLGGIGPTNWTYSIVATTNLSQPLTNWVQVHSGTFTDGTFTFTDRTATNYPRRFYRVVTP